MISGTIFAATKLPLSRWFLAMHLLTQSKNNVAALELERHLGVCYKTAWLVKHKLMEFTRVREDDRQFDGRVEIDDAYLGGERSGGKRGRGSDLNPPYRDARQDMNQGAVAMRENLPHTCANGSELGRLVRMLTAVEEYVMDKAWVVLSSPPPLSRLRSTAMRRRASASGRNGSVVEGRQLVTLGREGSGRGYGLLKRLPHRPILAAKWQNC